MGVLRTKRLVSALLALCVWGATAPRASATLLTGLIEFSTTSSGDADGLGAWNTLGGDAAYDLWLAEGDIGGPFLNGPEDYEAGVAIPLPDGIHQFDLRAAPDFPARSGPWLPHLGLNLFFNGDAVTPGISVFASELGTPPPTFFANSGYTLTLDAAGTAGAGTLSFVDGSTMVELTDFFWGFGLGDRVGHFSAHPDGDPDLIGRLTLVVHPVPEPGAGWLLGVGALWLLVGFRGRRGGTAGAQRGPRDSDASPR